jgi:16S rRNA (guanine(966)-N(2))-methyltransferase RsmD
MRVISGSARNKPLLSVEGMDTRPTIDRVKEGIFSSIQFIIPGAKILDLFSGTGQMGIEALSRGANRAVFIDEREDACRLIKENLKRTKLEAFGRVIRSDYMSYLKTCKDKFDIILLDPPYAEVFLENSLKMITEIDILQSSGIIGTERPLGKELPWEFPGFERSRDYKYGNTLITIYRKL